MNKLITTQQGRMPFFLDDLGFMDSAVRDAIYGMMSAFGVDASHSFKLSGCVVAVNGNEYVCSAGYISLEGEIYKVDAHTHTHVSNSVAFVPVITYDPAGNKLFATNPPTAKDVYQIRKAKLDDVVVGLNGVMSYNADDLHAIIRSKLRTYNENYTSLGTLYYRKNALNEVFLSGYIDSTSETLPVGYRPSVQQDIYLINHTGSINQVRITTAGVVSIIDGQPGETVSLNGISFITAQ